MKPFSTYPEDRAELLRLANIVLTEWANSPKPAVDLADKVKAILEDEQYGIDAKVYGGAK